MSKISRTLQAGRSGTSDFSIMFWEFRWNYVRHLDNTFQTVKVCYQVSVVSTVNLWCINNGKQLNFTAVKQDQIRYFGHWKQFDIVKNYYYLRCPLDQYCKIIFEDKYKTFSNSVMNMIHNPKFLFFIFYS